MTQKRKAELQRKLSMAPVAKPPAHLADRLKADIPEYLNPQRDRERVNRSLAFSLRVAASVILLVTSVFLTIEFLSQDETSSIIQVQRPATAKVADAVQAKAVETEATSKDEAALAGEDTGPPVTAPVTAPVLAPVPAPVPASAPPPPAAPVVARIAERRAEAPDAGMKVEVTGAAVDVATFATAASARASAPPAPAAESAESAEFVDVEAVVNHFAGRPEEQSNEVQLEVEASRAPLSEDGKAVIRYTIDMPAAGEQSQVTRANLSIALETGVIESYRTIGSARPLRDAGGELAGGQSATGLVEIKLAEETRSYQRVATILLDYISPATGRRKHERKVIYAHDLDRGWSSASRRHRLATLSAVWGESLTGSPRPVELAQMAAALAEEAPGDALAQELAAATASSRRRSSSPTGSGR